MRYFLLFMLLITSNAFALEWQSLEPGLSYTKIIQNPSRAWNRIHVFRIDPKRYQFKLAIARENQQSSARVKEFALDHKALIAINGGFFTAKGDPIGLRISSGEVKQRLHGTSWWGVFYIENQRPRIVAQKAFKKRKHINFALQSGPRLVVNGKIPNLKDNYDQRTALGITQDKKVIIVVTEHNPMTTTELALVMRGLLNCQYALNLDGGSSTQLYAQVGTLNLHVHGLSSVSDAVIVLPR